MENKSLHYTAITELSVIKDTGYETERSLYEQILSAFPGVLPVARITTPFVYFPLDNTLNRWLKRSLDIGLSLIVIIGVLSWFIPIMAIIIKLDSRGPVFFLQRRTGRNGLAFTCIKFRSMVLNDVADIMPAIRNDTRVTRVGRFIRKNFIDELPQFFNVFIGDMSVIGPRPHMLSDNLRYEECVEHYHYRMRVKPGITGLAQVMGYVGEADSPRKMNDRVRMDIFYLRHWTFRLDLVIILRTIIKTIGG